MAIRIMKNEKLFRLLKAILRTMNNSRFNTADFYFRKCNDLDMEGNEGIFNSPPAPLYKYNREGRSVYVGCLLIAFTLLQILCCHAQDLVKPVSLITANTIPPKIICGAEQMDILSLFIGNKSVALMVNQTSTVGSTPLIDTLLANGVHIRKIFAPEHGFRGTADAGQKVNDSVDIKTGIPIVSLYGKKTKPTSEDLKGIDIVLFDIQDVGARFYTFISSLHYLMVACAENNKKLIVLDRPNPNGWYVDGPVLKKEFSSFVGVDPVPVVYGLTVGEYAQMANGEKWIGDKKCDLQVITCLNYTHKMHYSLPVPPSPNLPNDQAVALYPSLCFFEGTNVSVGRGTGNPFQIIGSPYTKFDGAYTFTPQSTKGARNPPFLNQKCYGYDLSNENVEGLTFKYLLDMYHLFSDKSNFFLKGNFFDKLCGTDEIRKMIQDGKTEKEIKTFYHKELEEFKAKRKKYLLYEDF